MLYKAKTLKGFLLYSLDGDIGKVEEFYFDDYSWTIRYMVVNTGNWLTVKQVLIAPNTLVDVNKEEEYISINLTKKQIEDSPPLNQDKPVSKQFEEDSYYSGPFPTIVPDPLAWKKSATDHKAWDHHLRSIFDVTGHDIQATDGEIGHVDDFIIDDKSWEIRYLVIDTQNWWPGKKVLISPQWVERVSWKESKVFVNLLRETIKQSPEYTEESRLTQTYETGLYQYYNHQR